MTQNLMYLASPYNHVDPEVRQRRFEANCRAVASMLRYRNNVFSPICHNHPIIVRQPDITGWKWWGEFDLTILERCSHFCILALPGWAESPGVAREENYFTTQPDRQNKTPQFYHPTRLEFISRHEASWLNFGYHKDQMTHGGCGKPQLVLRRRDSTSIHCCFNCKTLSAYPQPPDMTITSSVSCKIHDTPIHTFSGKGHTIDVCWECKSVTFLAMPPLDMTLSELAGGVHPSELDKSKAESAARITEAIRSRCDHVEPTAQCQSTAPPSPPALASGDTVHVRGQSKVVTIMDFKDDGCRVCWFDSLMQLQMATLPVSILTRKLAVPRPAFEKSVDAVGGHG